MSNPYLDTAIAAGVIYFLFSILASVIQELWASFKESRGRMLRKAIYDLLNDRLNSDYGVRLLSHPQFNFLKETDNSLPSYLPASNFAQALIDIITRDAYEYQFHQNSQPSTDSNENLSPEKVKVKLAPTQPKEDKNLVRLEAYGLTVTPEDQSREQFQLFCAALSQMKHSNLKILIQNISNRSTDLDSLTTNLEKWYNEYMKRVNGWYMRSTRKNLRWIGIILAILFNIHCFDLISEIYSDRQLRDKLVEKGISIIDNPETWQKLYDPILDRSLSSIDTQLEQQVNAILNDSTLKDKQASIAELRQKAFRERTMIADSVFTLKQQHLGDITDTLRLWELPIGWHISEEKGTAASAQGHTTRVKNLFSIIWLALGWLISGLAISAGAPFWFNAISKLINVRRSGLQPEKDEK